MWVLIAIIVTAQPALIPTAGFETLDACKAALEDLRGQLATQVLGGCYLRGIVR